MKTLLAIDLGLRTGLALFGADGRLRWYRSSNFGSAARMKRAVHAILNDIDARPRLVLEGGGPLAEIWRREAERRGLDLRRISAEEWRCRLLLERQQRTGPLAKASAGDLARRVIAWSGLPRPISLRHDAAEAILVGLWGVLDCDWLAGIPPELGP